MLTKRIFIALTLSLTLAFLATFVLGRISSTYAASIIMNSLADIIADDSQCTLREAITAANTDTASGVTVGECIAGNGADTINFSVTGTISLTSALPDISTNIVFNGLGASILTVSGGGNVRVFKITGGDVTISGLTIADGYAGPDDGHGGGIFNSSPGTVTVISSTLYNNQARGTDGQNAAYPVAVSGCCFGGGGGIFQSGPGLLNISFTTLVSNTAQGGHGGGGGAFGGGLFNDGGTVIIRTSNFSTNQAVGGDGGAIGPCGSTGLSGPGGDKLMVSAVVVKVGILRCLMVRTGISAEEGVVFVN